jgi:hypothetical protein
MKKYKEYVRKKKKITRKSEKEVLIELEKE